MAESTVDVRRPVAGDLEIRGHSRAEVAAWTAVDVVTFMANELEARGYRSDIVAKCADTRAAVAALIAYAECEEAQRLSLLPTSKGGTGDGQSYLATFHRHGFEGRDVYGFLDKLRRTALARVGGAS